MRLYLSAVEHTSYTYGWDAYISFWCCGLTQQGPGILARGHNRRDGVKEQELWVNGEEGGQVNGAQTVFNRRNYAIARRWAWTGSHLSQWVETS